MAEILELNNRQYVAGLFWQTIATSEDFSEIVQERAHELNRDLACSVRFPAPQAGFLNSHELPAKSSRPYSLAGHLLKSSMDDWIGVFKVGTNRYYFIAVQNNMILQQADRVGERDEIAEQFYELVRSSQQGRSWGTVIVPSDITIEERDPDWEQRDLEVFLSNITETAPVLEPVEFEWTPERVAGITTVTALALVVFYALFGLPFALPDVTGWFADQQTTEKQVSQQKKAEGFSPPDFTHYHPGSVVSNCQFSQGRIPYMASGFRLTSYTCQPTRIVAIYEPRTQDVLPGRLRPYFDRVNLSGKTQGYIEFTDPLRDSFEPTRASFRQIKPFMSRLFTGDVTTITWDTQHNDPYNAPDCTTDKTDKATKPVCVLRFTIESELRPSSIKHHLNQPGLYIRNMTRYFADRQGNQELRQTSFPWRINGGIYFQW